jgi:site-specific DNA-methyltransferase (adenine-specific)
LDGKQRVRADREASTGGASRFFRVFEPEIDVPFIYCAKSSRRERNAGCEGLPEAISARYGEKGQGPLPQQTPHVHKPEGNHHPTVKPIALMRYLCRLVTPPSGVVLDPFCGSGSTGVAAVLEGFDFIGVEMDPDYMAIATARIEAAAATFRQLELV